MLPAAHPDGIEDYVEALYEEEMDAKANGAQRVLRLCTNVQMLEDISEHSMLLGVLSRELRENAKRSHDMAIAITGIFVCLAHYTYFHPVLSRNNCGEVTMRIVEYESRRRALLHKDLKQSQGQIVARGSAATPEDKDKVDREERRYQAMVDRQDRLLLLCLTALRDLAEDPLFERKLVQQRICSFLIPLLSRQNEELLFVTLGFLHKLSIFEVNKDQVVQSTDALCRLADLCGHQSSDVCLLALRLCHNVTFDARGRMVLCVQTTLLSRLVEAVQRSSLRKLGLKVLYNLSMEGQMRAAMASKCPNCVSLSLHVAAKCREHNLDAESAALCINFATDEACAALMVEAQLFSKAVLRAVQSADTLLLKVVRNVASHASVRLRMLEVMRGSGGEEDAWLHELVRLATSCGSERPALQLEALGVFSALDCTSDEVPWPDLCEAGLLDLLHRLLMPGFSENDVLLESIIIAGTLALDLECVPMLAASKVPRLLPDLLMEKQDDSEILAQLLFTMRCMLMQEEISEVLLEETDAPGLVLDILKDIGEQAKEGDKLEHKTLAIQDAAEEVIDLVAAAESDMAEPRWLERIRAFRFEEHNALWCEKCSAVEEEEEDAPQTPEKVTAESRGWIDVTGLAERQWGGRTGMFKTTRHR